MTDEEARKAFLLELYRSTNAKEGAQISMYTVGAGVGLDRPAAKKTAEDLIGMGLVEIRTLSGAVGITSEGLAAARMDGAAPAGENGFHLSDGPGLDDRDRQGLATLLDRLRQEVAKASRTYAQLEELVIAIKTMEVHLLSPRPDRGVVKALLNALKSAFSAMGDAKTADHIDQIIR